MPLSLSNLSDPSEDEDEEIPMSPDKASFSAVLEGREVKIMDEDQIFKPAGAGQEEATFVLEDVIIFQNGLPNPRIANLLEIQFVDPSVFVVQGRLVLEQDQYKYVKKTALKSTEEPYIQIKTVAFSIGSDSGSYPIWAYGQDRWFEINPRSEYKEMYRHMVEGVTFYYALTDFHEKIPEAPVERSLSRCAQRKGGTDGFRKIVQAVKSHGGFLLAQMMMHDREVNWEITEIYQWLAYECSKEYRYLLMKAGKDFQPLPLPTIGLTVPILAPWPHGPKKIDISEDEDEGDSMIDELALKHYSSKISRFAVSETIKKSSKNASMSRVAGLDDPVPGESSGSILAKLAIAGGKQNNTNDFSIKMLVAWVNRGFSIRSKFGARPEKGGISDHHFAADIVTTHALSILEHLPGEWKNRRLGKDLRAAPNEDPFVGLTSKKQKDRRQEIRDEAAAFKLKLRKEVNTMRKPELTFHVSSGRPRKVDATTTPPKGFRQGRVSGKAASLRTPGASITRHVSSEDESSSETNEMVSGPAYKRRRVSPPEIGEDDDENESISGDQYSIPIRETGLLVKIDPLPEIAGLSPAEVQQVEDDKKKKLDVVHREAALNNRNSSYLEEFLAARKSHPIQRSPLL